MSLARVVVVAMTLLCTFVPPKMPLMAASAVELSKPARENHPLSLKPTSRYPLAASVPVPGRSSVINHGAAGEFAFWFRIANLPPIFQFFLIPKKLFFSSAEVFEKERSFSSETLQNKMSFSPC